MITTNNTDLRIQRMKRLLSIHCFLVIAATATDAWAHGFSLHLSGTLITAASEAPFAGTSNPNIFYDQFGAPIPDGSIGTFEGFGFGDFSFCIPGTPTFTFNIVSPLFYASGGLAVPAFVDPSHTNHG